MKWIFCLLLLIAPAWAGPDYDADLARRLQADEYGMRPYVIAFLRTGPNRATDPAERERLQAAHLANIRRLAAEGKLSLAGPFLDENTDLRGLYVFNVTTLDEARQLTESDPLVQSGGLVMELRLWYGPATLQQVPETNRRVESKSF